MVNMYVCALAAALFHFKFFVMESLLWGSPVVNKIFKLKPEVAKSDAVRSFAFNMGFYNLFLSAGTLGGLYLLHQGAREGRTLLAFCCASMVGAGIVLLMSGGLRRLPAALVQAGPPGACLYFLFS
jgi:putative membrane protein